MYKLKRLFKSFFRLLFPIVLLIVLAVLSASVWLVYVTARPQTSAYIVTPDKYGMLSTRGAQVTDEKWQNKDGTAARGWLLRGGDNLPGVVLLHKYGADRSYVLNLGVKLNEATNFTILMPDARGHGAGPLVETSSFGGKEGDDAAAAVDFLRGIKTTVGAPLVSKTIGLYGVEIGALAGLSAASKDPNITAVVFDSIPQDSNALLSSVISKRFPFASTVTSEFGKLGANLYFYEGAYVSSPACEQARLLANRKVLLLAGFDAPEFQNSTSKLGKCLPGNVNVETKLDMSPSGYSIMSTSIEQSGAYDQRVIDFFRIALASS